MTHPPRWRPSHLVFGIVALLIGIVIGYQVGISHPCREADSEFFKGTLGLGVRPTPAQWQEAMFMCSKRLMECKCP